MAWKPMRSRMIRRIPPGIMAPERPKNIIGLSGSFSILGQILYDWPSFRLWNEVALNASSTSLTDGTFATSWCCTGCSNASPLGDKRMLEDDCGEYSFACEL